MSGSQHPDDTTASATEASPRLAGRRAERLLRVADIVNETVGRIVSFFVVAIVLVVLYDITARNVFRVPTQWAFAMTTQLYAAHFMLLGGYAVLHDAHIRVDVIREHLSRRSQHVLELIGYVVFFFPFMATLIWFGWRYAMRSWAAGETTYGAVMQIPVYPVKTTIFLAAVLMTLQGLAQFVRSILHLRRGL